MNANRIVRRWRGAVAGQESVEKCVRNQDFSEQLSDVRMFPQAVHFSRTDRSALHFLGSIAAVRDG